MFCKYGFVYLKILLTFRKTKNWEGIVSMLKYNISILKEYKSGKNSMIILMLDSK